MQQETQDVKKTTKCGSCQLSFVMDSRFSCKIHCRSLSLIVEHSWTIILPSTTSFAFALALAITDLAQASTFCVLLLLGFFFPNLWSRLTKRMCNRIMLRKLNGKFDLSSCPYFFLLIYLRVTRVIGSGAIVC